MPIFIFSTAVSAIMNPGEALDINGNIIGACKDLTKTTSSQEKFREASDFKSVWRQLRSENMVVSTNPNEKNFIVNDKIRCYEN